MKGLTKLQKHGLLLIGIVLLCAVLAQYVLSGREGMDNMSNFTGLMFFTTKTCPHCVAMKPTIDRLKDAYPQNVKVVDCSQPTSNEAKELMTEHKINGFPTILQFKNGEKVGSPIEDRDYTSLEKVIKSA